ncbi:NAD(P)-binding protein [Exidia glandulosa HHB12029]|uniref:NAD(P)-binding protein n=1 Tax=Exidia glandulosa HHB12029 TaxID=1314781 RepID=A0A165PIT7_EXIGL|nr:NAD(P)-binding protein [Exidia glandulosa HHB12029]
MPTISPPATVLLSLGASGFVAIHVAKTFLERGYHVLGSVRSASKGTYLQNLFDHNFPGRFRYISVPDICAPTAWDEAVKGVHGIAHVASPCHHEDAVDADEFIRPAVDGTLNLLKSAAQFGPEVARIVITSSNATILEQHDPPYVYSNKDWCNFAVEEVNTLGNAASGVAKYMASKVLAERAANDWLAQNKVHFDITHVLPSWVYGAPIQDVHSPEALNISVKRVYEWFVDGLPESQLPTASGWYIDVRDVARAHVDVLEREDLGSQRLVVSRAENPAYQDVYDAYLALPDAKRPKLPFPVPRGVPGIADDVRCKFSTHETAEAVLGWKFRALGESIAWTLEGIADKGLFSATS